jgi:hypothetical protein
MTANTTTAMKAFAKGVSFIVSPQVKLVFGLRFLALDLGLRS